MGLFGKSRPQTLEAKMEAIRRVEEAGGDLAAALAESGFSQEDYSVYRAKADTKPEFVAGFNKPAPKQYR
jgi:hypothetical protein